MSKLRTTLAVLLALFAILTLLERFVLVELLLRRAAVPMLLALGEAVAILAVGALMRRTKRVDPAVDFLIGYPVFGALCFLVGAMTISAWTMIPLLAIFGLAGVALLLMRYAEEKNEEARQPVPMHRTAFLAVVVVLACGFVTAQAPPASPDELAYHLAVPRTWVLEGRAIELPLLSHSYFPLGIQSADVPLLTLLGAAGGGIASHFLHLIAAFAVALLIARRTNSWLATAAIVTTPALAITAGWSLVDWPLAGLFVILWTSLEDGDAKTASAATAAGLLVKYIFLPFAALAWILKRRVPSWIVVVGLIFFARNAILTGNPIAPFLGGGAPPVSGYRELALSEYVFQADFIGEAIGASLLILAPFATGLLPVASVFAAVALFFLGPSSRILVPFLVVAAMSAAPQLRRRLVSVMVAIAVVVQTFLVIWVTARGNSFSLLAGTASEEEYLNAQRPSYRAVTWLNEMIPPNSRTLVVGLTETFWFTKPVRGGGTFDGPRMSRYLDLPTPEALRERLRRDGITHVAVLAVPMTTTSAQKREERQTTLSPAAQKMLSQMLDRHAANISSRGSAIVFTLR